MKEGKRERCKEGKREGGKEELRKEIKKEIRKEGIWNEFGTTLGVLCCHFGAILGL